MVAAQDKAVAESDKEFGVANYSVNSEARFNFSNKSHKVPQQKLKRYVERLMEQKAKIPGPSQYASTQH